MSDDGSSASLSIDVNKVIKSLRNVDPETKRITKHPKFQELVRGLVDYTSDDGLTAHQLELLIDVAASSTYFISRDSKRSHKLFTADTVSGKLIRCMLPNQHVPEIVALKAISWMTCSMKPSITVQALLFRWLVLVYEYITPKDKLHAMYGIIFHFLNSDVLRNHVCHLLFQMTRRDDITIFRVRQLLSIQRVVGQQPPIMGLLSVYRLYHPNLVLYTPPRRRMVFFRRSDKPWSMKIRSVRERHLAEADEPNVSMARLSITDPFKSPVSKKARVSSIPTDLTSASAQRAGTRRGKHRRHDESVGLAQMESFEELLQNMDRIEFPPQVAVALKNEFLRHVISCNPDEIVASRLSYWLGHVLFDDILGTQPEPRGEVLLNSIAEFADFLDEGIPAVDQFLIHYLSQWNGNDYRAQILSLLTRLRLYNVVDLKLNLLEPLSRLMTRSSVFFKCQVILCLSELLENYILVELERYKEAQELVDTSATSVEARNLYSVFRDDIDDVKPYETLRHLIDGVYSLCVKALLQEKGNTLLLHCTLNFTQMVLRWQEKGRLPYISLPPPMIVHTALFAREAYSLTRLGEILCSCRSIFLYLKSTEARLNLDPIIRQLNNHTQTIMDAIWLRRPFLVHKKREASVYRDVEPIIQALEIPLPNLSLSIYHHQALLPYALAFMEELEVGVQLPSELKEYETGYLDFLYSVGGLTGLHQFLMSSSKRLISMSMTATAGASLLQGSRFGKSIGQ